MTTTPVPIAAVLPRANASPAPTPTVMRPATTSRTSRVWKRRRVVMAPWYPFFLRGRFGMTFVDPGAMTSREAVSIPRFSANPYPGHVRRVVSPVLVARESELALLAAAAARAAAGEAGIVVVGGEA